MAALNVARVAAEATLESLTLTPFLVTHFRSDKFYSRLGHAFALIMHFGWALCINTSEKLKIKHFCLHGFSLGEVSLGEANQFAQFVGWGGDIILLSL